MVLQNPYGAAATEWLITITYPGPAGAPCRPGRTDAAGNCTGSITRHKYGLPAVGKSQPISAHGSQAIMAPSGAAITVRAVIYADGASAGDPIIIQDMVQARQVMLDDLRQVIPMLNTAAANPQADYSALQASLTTSGQQHRQAMLAAYHALGGAGGIPITSDRVRQPLALDIAQDLKAGLSAKAMSARYAYRAHLFATWEQQLEASKPALH